MSDGTDGRVADPDAVAWVPSRAQRWEWVVREAATPAAGLAVSLAVVAWSAAATMAAARMGWVAMAVRGPVWPLVALGAVFLGAVLWAFASAWLEGGAVVEGPHMTWVYHSSEAWVAPKVMSKTRAAWVERRAAYRRKTGESPTVALRGGTIHVFADPPAYPVLDPNRREPGEPIVQEASAAWPSLRIVELGRESVGTEDHLHELDHLLAHHQYAGMPGWGEMGHDERIDLLDEFADERGGGDG